MKTVKKEKIPKKLLASYLNYLNKNKSLVGFADYTISINSEYEPLDDTCLAECFVDMYEKNLRLLISDKFKKMTIVQIENVLIHELIHARVDLFNQKIVKNNELEEEFLVNDLTRGIQSLTEVKLEKI